MRWLIKPLIESAEGVILCIIIGDVHSFIGHCLIPLDPWCLSVYAKVIFNVDFCNNKALTKSLNER